MANAKSAGNKRAAHSVTESPGFTNGRARSERRIASGNRRSGAIDAIDAIKAVPKAVAKRKASLKKAKKKS